MPGVEQRLAVRAIWWVLITRVLLRLFSFTRVRGLTVGRANVRVAAQNDWPRAVRRAVIRASRSVPGTACLAQSLVAERLLRAGGHPALLSIGVADPVAGTARKSLDAHAWVESAGVLVTGDDPHDQYQLLATFGSG